MPYTGGYRDALETKVAVSAGRQQVPKESSTTVGRNSYAILILATLPAGPDLGRSQDNRCRHCHNEVETLGHVLGSCPHGKTLQNARHHQVRSIIATALKDADYNNFEEVHGLSITCSTQHIDIIAFKKSTRSGYIIDPTVHFETDEEQPAKVDNEKNNIYNPTIPYYLKKYQLKELEVIGLMVGARGTATLFMKDVFQRLGIPKSIIPIVTLAALKGSIALLKNHLY
ncbi:hypothetical protein ANN_06977 [Periplaneta americana]|uniref:Reverse transcriptase n=1 Tax=Periplaneta americana TaxID=6978 RepID=A0ABQ8TGD0_PERAM|nr:hypothetical protein ANN_06977 [Periplaneta americana]